MFSPEESASCPPSPRTMPDLPPLKLLVAIVDREQHKQVVGFFRGQHMRFLFASSAMGTASSDIMDMLGLGGVDKSVFLSVVPRFAVKPLMEGLLTDVGIRQRGVGIAFTIPISGVCAAFGRLFSEEGKEYMERQEGLMEKKAEQMKSEVTHELIIAMVNQGSSDDLMDAARAAGAGGGTVMHAHRIGAEETSKFFGISVQPEKEVVAILVSREQKKVIMKAVNAACGLQTQSRGIIFSLPVDSVAGLTPAE